MTTFTTSTILRKKIKGFAALLILLSVFTGIHKASATHSAGADLTYRCLGGNQYLIEVTFYRDCGGVAEPANVPVTYKSATLGQTLTVTANKIANTGQEITVPCASSASTCNGGTGTGIRKFVYQATVTLPGAAADWKFSYHVCCRNCSITTIQNPCATATELYVESTLNNVAGACNNSPTFSNIPIAFVCIGQTFNYNHGVLDADGDSLAYEFITPKISESSNVTFISPATATTPISSSTPFTLSPTTGQISFTPNQVQIGIMAIRVKEYRNGTLIGTVIRDMQIYTTPCSNNLPTATGINGTSNYSVNACANQQICFSINTADADASQTVTVTTNNGIAGATYTIGTGTRPTVNFCWTPTLADIDLSPRSFIVTVRDNACPNNGIQTYSYNVTVSGPDFNIASTNLSCNGSNNGAATATPVYAGAHTYLWSTGATTQAVSNLAAGTYTVTLTNSSGCTLSKSVAITQPAVLNNTTSQTNISCAGLCNGAINSTVTGGTSPYSYTWSSGQTTQNVTGRCVGTYTVTVTDARGCTTVKTVTLTNVSNMAASVAGTNILCRGGLTGAGNLTVSGGITPYAYTWSNGATTEDLSGVAAGTYTVTITDGNACTKSASVSITQPSASLSSSLSSSTPVSCNGGSNGSINLAVSGGTSPYTFDWSNGATTQNLTALSAGSYTVTVHDANGCTTSTASISITQPSGALAGHASSTGNVSCFGGNNGSVDLSVTGGTSPYTYNWSNGVTTQDLTNVIAGTYSVTVTDARGCTDATTGITISQPGATVSASVSSTNNVSCFGGTNGSINLTVSGGTSPYSYNWSNGANSQNLSGIVSGSYTVTVTDAHGCTRVVSAISITQPPAALSGSVTSSSNVSCFGGSNGSINLTVNGGTSPYTYTWSNGTTTQDLTNVVAGTYGVTTTDAQGCTSLNSGISITQPAAVLNSTATSTTNVSCFGGNNGAVNLTVTGGTSPYSYNWNNGTTTQDLSNIPAGNYAVIVTDAHGCTSSTSGLTIGQPSAALASSNTHGNVLCRGNSTGSVNLSVSGGTSPYSYNWSNGAVSQNISNILAGSYTVTITDANGCTSVTSSIIVSQPAAVLTGSATTTGNVACNSGANGAVNLSVNGGTAPYTYSWSNGATTQDINSLFAGNYVVTITDANGCSATSASIVSQPEGALASTINTSQNVSCYNGDNGAIQLTVNGGTTPYVFNWSNGATTQNISELNAGSYTVTVTDANACINISTAVVSQPSGSLGSSANSTSNVSCFGGNNGDIDITVIGGTAPYTYNWSNGSHNQDLNNVTAGSYSVSVTDANGCTAQSAAITISQPAAALNSSASSTNNVSCFGGTNGTINLSVSGGTLPYSYNWSTGDNTQNLNNLVAGNYSVTVTDANGCTSQTAAISISQPVAALNSGANSSNNVSCFGGTNGAINLGVTGGTTPYTYNWSNGAVTEDLSNIPAGTYSVIITDAHGCTTATAGVTISQPAASLVSSVNTSNNVSCFGGSNGNLNLSVNGGTSPYTFTWSNGATTQNLTGIVAGTYAVSVSDAQGCTTSNTGLQITQPGAALNSHAGSTTGVSCNGGANGGITLVVAGGTAPYNYQWSNGANTQNLSNISAGSYTVTVTDINGCSSTTAAITVAEPPAALSSNVNSTSDVSCFAGANGNVTLNVTGGTAPYTFNWSNGTHAQNLSNVSAGTYSVIIIDNNGCSTTSAAITITQPSAALSASVTSSQNVFCYSGTNGTIDLTVSGGTLPYSYNWSNGANSQDINGLAAGSYTVTITDINGCSFTQFATISQPSAALSTSSTVSQNVSCFGGSNASITLSANGGTAPYYYNWSNGSTTQNINNIPSGIYNVTVTDANGCTSVQSKTVTQPIAALSATASVSQNVSCFFGNNGAVNLTVNGGTSPYSYAWNNGSTAQNINGLSAGTYAVIVTDINGCTVNQSQSITQPAAGLAASTIVTQHVSCFAGANGSVNLYVSGGTIPYSYSWSNGVTTQDLINLASGTYTVTITDANGCTYLQNAIITQPSATLSASTNVTQNVSCNAGANGAVNLTVNGGTAPYSFQWSNGAATEDISNLAAGTYSVTISDANGCVYSQSATITQPIAALSASSAVTGNISCFSGNNGSIDLSVNGGTAPYSYNWNTGANSQDLAGLSAGTYSVIISDANGCTTDNSATITQPAGSLSSSISVGSNVACNGGNNGSIDLSVSGGTMPYSYNWSNGSTVQDLSNLASGVYTATITDANGCFSSVTGTVSQPVYPLGANAAVVQNVSCNAGANGSINLTVNGGTIPYTYAWSNSATTEDINNLTAGIYTVNITDANGCTQIASVSISQPTPALSAFAAVTQSVSCFAGANGSINLSVNGGTAPYSYSWSNGASTQDISGLISGSYVVNVTDANGCTQTSSATINQPSAALAASASVSQNVSCNTGSNGAINLTVNGGSIPYTYNWSNGSSSQNIGNLIAGTYSVSITDVNGCTAFQSATITQPSAALSSAASVTQNVSCFSGSNGSIDLTVSGGTAPYSYNWNNGANTQDLSNLSAGSYSVNITDANGCTSAQSATITQPAGNLASSVSATQNVLCFAGTNGTIDVTVNGGTAPYSYNWSNGMSTQDLTGLGSGTYTVNITDANGCTSSQSASITQPTAALSSSAAVIQNVSCFAGTNGSIDLSVNGGTAPYTFIWSNGTSTEDLSNLAAGSYTVSVSDANGCSSSQTKTISQPTATLSSTADVTGNISCFSGNDGSIDLTVTGGTLPYSYTWSTGTTTQDLGGLAAGAYTVSISDANGCTSTSTATIAQPAGALATNLSISQQVSCFGGANGSVDLSVSGGTTPYIYTWSNGASTEDISNLSAGVYTASIYDANGCNSFVTATITQPSGSLSANASVSQNVSCFSGTNGSVNLNVSAGTAPYSYNWSNNATTQNLSNLTSGNYSVTVTDANGCTTNASATITQPAGALSASASVSQQVSCNGGDNGSINLTVTDGTSPYTFVWSNGAQAEDLNNLTSGTYSVTITDANGCIANASASVTQPTGALTASAAASHQVNCFGGSNGSVDLTVTAGTAPYTYSWNNGAQTEDLNNVISGTYTVDITDANGCLANASATVTQPLAALNTNAIVDQNVSCNGGNNGSINLIVNDGTSPYTYTWSNGATTEDAANLAAGSYTVTVTDANGCISTETRTVSQPSAALSSATTVTGTVSCFSGNNGAINLTVSGGTLPYTYVWNTGASTEDISGLSAGIYSVSITDANGCTSSSSAEIEQPAGALATNLAISQQVSCFGGANGSFDLTVSGGTTPYTYTWSNGATTEDLSNLSSGVYSATIQDANGCNTSVTATITQPSGALNASASVSQQVSCFSGNNGSIDLTTTDGTAPYTYAWSNGATTEDINNLASGNYSVAIADANGCTTSASASVTQPNGALNASLSVSQQVSCFGGNNGSIDLTVTAGTAPYSYNWSTGAITEDISNLTTGTYSVTVSDANGCISNAGASVTQPSGALSANSVVTQQVSCNAGNNGSIDLTVADGTAPYTFTWSNGATTEDIGNLLSGAYTVTVTDANGCIADQTNTITQPSGALAATATVTGTVSCFSGNNGSIDLEVSGGTQPYSFNWNTGASTEDLSGLSAGIYSVSITDANGCTSNSGAEIIQPVGALAANLSITQQVSCFGGANGSVDLSVNGGTTPYTYSWSNGSTTEDINNLSAGVYTGTVYDVNGCNTSVTATITEPTGALNASAIVSQQVSCNSGNNGAIDLTTADGTAPYTFVWNNGATTEDITNLSYGTYSVTVTDANGCTVITSAVITQPAGALNASASVSQQVSCNGGANGSIDLTVIDGTAPYAFEWSNGSTTEDINGLNAGNYNVTVTDANGCVYNTTATVTEPSGALTASANVSQNVSCFGGINGAINLTVTAGTAPYSFNWSNGSSTEDISGVNSGTYTVDITDANGCTANTSAIVSQPAAGLNASVSISQNVSCFGGTNGTLDLNVSDGTAPYTFNWSNGATTEDLSNLVIGTYSVTVSDANGCSQMATATITQPSASLSASAAVTQNVSCFSGANGEINLTINGGTLPYTYVWSNGAATQNQNGLASGNYSVTITDANGCSAVSAAIVTQPSASVAASMNITQQVNCASGSNGAIDLTITGGTAPYSILWSNGSTTEDAANLAAGSYSVNVTDANGCSATQSADITQPANALNANASASQNVSCFGGSNGTVNVSVNGGTAPYSFLWNEGSVTQNLSNVSQGTYTVTVSDANGCVQTTSASITQPSASVSVSGSGSTSTCLSGITGNVTININGGVAPYVYQWSNGATTQNLANQGAGTYSVTVTDANGCSAAGSYVITDNSSFQANAAGPSTVCIGELVTLVADSVPGATYQWYMNGQILGGATYNMFVTPAAGSFTVSITNACGTFTSDAIVVTVNTIEDVSISSNVIICPGESTQLSASGGIEYTWTPVTGLDYANVPNPVASPSTTTQYVVTVANAAGCKTSAEVLVTVLCDTLIIPSGFSPNSDNVNDGFVIEGIDHYPGNKIWIYNRWGNLVYKAHDYENKWDGLSNVSGIYIGKKVPAGTYYYVLDLNNNTKPLSGYIVLRY